MPDNTVLIRALLDKADEDHETEEAAITWLRGLRDEALAAVLAGDIEITSNSYEGGSATGMTRFNSQNLLDATQHALEDLLGKDHQLCLIPHFSNIPR